MDVKVYFYIERFIMNIWILFGSDTIPSNRFIEMLRYKQNQY